MDKLLAMSTFVEIVDQGSLTAAAKSLNKSLPSIVRTLANLEESIQVKLLNRTTRRIALTEEGKHFLVRCRQILNSVEEAESEAINERTEPKGIVRITAPVTFGQMHAAPALFKFLRKYPQVRAELLLYNRIVNLLEEGVDFALRIAHLEDSSLVAIPLGYIERVVCASPDLLNRIKTPVHPEQIASLPCIGYGGINSNISFQFKKRGKLLNVPVSGAICSNDVSVTTEACLAGLGIASFFSYQIKPWLNQNKLKILLQEFQTDAIPVSLVYPQNRLLSARTKIALDWMKEEFRDVLGYQQ